MCRGVYHFKEIYSPQHSLVLWSLRRLEELKSSKGLLKDRNKMSSPDFLYLLRWVSCRTYQAEMNAIYHIWNFQRLPHTRPRIIKIINLSRQVAINLSNQQSRKCNFEDKTSHVIKNLALVCAWVALYWFTTSTDNQSTLRPCTGFWRYLVEGRDVVPFYIEWSYQDTTSRERVTDEIVCMKYLDQVSWFG